MRYFHNLVVAYFLGPPCIFITIVANSYKQTFKQWWWWRWWWW